MFCVKHEFINIIITLVDNLNSKFMEVETGYALSIRNVFLKYAGSILIIVKYVQSLSLSPCISNLALRGYEGYSTLLLPLFFFFPFDPFLCFEIPTPSPTR